MKFNSTLLCNLCVVCIVLLLNACNGGGTSLSNKTPLSDTKAITAYSINGVPGEIIDQNIILVMSVGTNVESLIATFTTTGTDVTVNGVQQISGVTANDFTSPVTYLVTAADGSVANYIVQVIVSDQYVFYISINKVDKINSTCSEEFAAQLSYNLSVDPQLVTLSGYYDILRATGYYDVVNYQNLGLYRLNPLGVAHAYDFGKWRDGDFIEINGQTYALYGTLFDVPGSCKDQSDWGECGVLSLLIDEDSTYGVCALY